MATDAELAEQANALLTPQKPEQAESTADFPWQRRQADTADFPWMVRREPPPEQTAAKSGAVDQQQIDSAFAAYEKTRSPLEWAEDVVKPSPMIEFYSTAAKRGVEDVAGIAAQTLRTAAFGLTAGGQPPNLQGLSVDQVKAVREQMLAQSNELSKSQDQIINSGAPEGLYAYLQAKQGLDQRIKEADGIIASGKPQAGPSGTTNPLAGSLMYAGKTIATPAVSGFLDKYIPTDQEFDNSLPGQIAKYGADGLTLGGLSALTGPIGGTVAGGMLMGNQAYDDAKAHGASDEVATRASLLTSLASGATMAVAGPVVGALAKSFAGLTAKQGMSALVQAGTYVGTRVAGGGAEFATINAEQNEIARLTGYDPNRKLDEGFWNSFFMGSMFGAVHVASAEMPHINRMMKPDVTVRNKDATPAQTGEQTQQQPTAAPVTPSAPTTPTTPEAQATAAAQAAASQTPEQVIAQANPEAELQKFMAAQGRTEPEPERGFVQVGGTPPTYTGPERPARPTLQLGGGERDAAAMPPAATEHGAEPVPSNTPGPPTTVEAPRGADVETRIVDAYKDLAQRTGRSSVFITDLIKESGLPADEVKSWLTQEAGAKGRGQLDEGDIGAATQVGKGDYVDFAGRKRVFADLSRPAQAREFPPTYVDEFGREIPPGPGQAKEVERAARESVRLARERAKPPQPAPEDPTAQRKAWYEGDEFANLPPVAQPEPEDRVVGPADVKREVNDAQDQMGMEDHLKYVPNVEALPDHVKSGLTEGERGGTAQIVRDNKLGDIYVIGDRFDSLNDLRRKIIEETLPYTYRNITKVGLTHDNTDPRTGHYDLMSDRPVLNTHAIISQDEPFREASRALMEEADAHQGISRLLGPRNGPVYVGVMDQLLQQFRRLGLIDKLAQMRGYENAQHMAQAYGVPKWDSNPMQAHKFTEELAAGWSRNFRNADELMRDGPSWWQNGLRRLNNSIRQFTGLRLSDYDVQSLLVDSAAALRRAKMDDHTSQFHPIGDAAKADMRDFQMASLPPETTATEAGETADIGTELVKAQARRLQASLRPGQFVREQNLARAMDTTHGLQERLNLLRANDAVENEQGHREVMQAANRVFTEDFNGNVDLALQHLIEDEMRPGASVPALNEVVDRNTDRRIEELRDAGLHDEANLLAARLDRMEQVQGRRTTESARELSAQRLRHETGATAVARSKNDTQDSQQHEIERPGQRNNKRKIKTGLDQVQDATQAAAESLKEKVKKATPPTYRRIGPGWGLREQYTQDLVDRIQDSLSKQGDVQDKAGLAQVYDSFRNTIQQIIKERQPPEERERQPISPMSTLRDVMSNYPAYEEAWKRTMDMLQTQDPALAQRFSSAIEEPVGETLANKLAGEQGTDLSDLIYNHYSTTDRINSDLASKIAQAATEGRLGPGQEWLANQQNAQGLANRLQTLFKDIVNKEQKARLQNILDSVGATHKPTPGELDQLVNHITIGGLDSAEWLNLVGPRFGIEGYTPEKLDALRAAGDYMSRLRDEGLDSSAIAQKTRAQIAELTQVNDQPWITRQFKYLNDVYASALLTGPLTHMPYWQQGLMTGGTDTLVQGIRAAIKAKDPNILIAMIPKAIAGYARGMDEFPSVFSGIKPSETMYPELPGTPRPPGPMEATPERLLSKFRYVRNFLEGVSNLMTKGPEYAVHYANMRYLLADEGLSREAAHEAASEVVLGTKTEQDQAAEYARDIADRYGLDKHQQQMLQLETLDKIKTTSDLADSSLANAETQRLRDVATRAYDTAMGGTLRGDVRGVLGKVSRGLLSFANEHPFSRPIAEFLKIPFNAINEFMAWTPVGMFRGVRDLVPDDTVLGRALSEIPFTKGGIESYVGKIPGMAKKIESGEFSQERIRDIAWNQMAKGLVGSTVAATLLGVVRSWLSNPNPPVQFSYQGPSQYGQQEIERGKGWQPRSVKIGGEWHSYENTPWRMLFSALGAYEDYFRYEKQDPNALSNEATAAWRGLAGGVTSAFGSPLQGLDALLNYFTQFGGQGAQRQVGNFATQLVGSLLTTPVGGTFTRQLWRAFVDQTEYEGNNIFEKAMRYIPVVNSMYLQPKLNVFGEHMTSNPLKAFPEYGNKVDPNDPVWNYLSTHPKIQLSMPGNQGSVAGIKMTPDEIYQFHLARGPALKEQLAEAFADPGFQTMPPALQNDLIKRTFEKVANRVGQARVLEYREAHPVTAEREAQTKAGQLEAALKQEEESTRLPEE